MTHTPNAENAPDEDRYHHGDLRRALIAAALALLTEEQDWSFSLREVARRAGVSHNAPYNHFASKHALLAAVAAAGFDTLKAHMQTAAAQTTTPEAALKAIGVAYVGFGVSNPAHYRLMFGTALSGGKPADGADCMPSAAGKSADNAKSLLRDVIRQGAEQGRFALSLTDTPALDMAVLGSWALVHGLTALLIDGLTNDSLTKGSTGAETLPSLMTAPAAEHIAAHVTQLLLDGIRIKNDT